MGAQAVVTAVPDVRVLDVAAGAARMLARTGPSAVPEVLGLLAAATGSSRVTLESFTAGRPVGLPNDSDDTVCVRVRRGEESVGLLRLHDAAGPRARELAGVVADLVALSWREELLVADEAARLEEIADQLHDGPVQDLVAARFGTEMLVRSAATDGIDAEDGKAVHSAVSAGLLALRRLMWDLRPRAVGSGLVPALEALRDRLGDSGDIRLDVCLDAGTGSAELVSGLTPTSIETAYRYVQAVLRSTAVAQREAPGAIRTVRVELRRTSDAVHLRISAVDLPDHAPWRSRAQAVGGSLDLQPHGSVLRLPEMTTHRPGRRPVERAGAGL